MPLLFFIDLPCTFISLIDLFNFHVLELNIVNSHNMPSSETCFSVLLCVNEKIIQTLVKMVKKTLFKRNYCSGVS